MAIDKKFINIINYLIENKIIIINQNPSEILAKLFAAIPVEIPIAKIIYPMKGFIINLLMQFY